VYENRSLTVAGSESKSTTAGSHSLTSRAEYRQLSRIYHAVGWMRLGLTCGYPYDGTGLRFITHFLQSFGPPFAS